MMTQLIEQVRDAMNKCDVDETNRLLSEIDKQLNGSGMNESK